ncbi:hypothetical protein CMV_002650 [Castanea mollissima]|uniref:Exocyst subunit Exo70 family protein n=1 Tax=Castanea mollissima TaxID=60419 RepID=A0A8J4VW00_9ROSI|nr:hypothetical protein CMV_002650 [Castanea mollissima]
MSMTTMTGINTAQHIVQCLNTPVRADENNEETLIDPKAVDELREIETRMVRQVYRERSFSLVAGSFFPSAKSEAGSGSWDWNETNPDSPLNISSLFPSNKSETDSSPEFSRSNSDSIMSIFLPATSPIDSPENYEIIVRSRSIPSYSIMSIFPPAMSEIGSPDNYEIIFRNPSIPSYYHFFPPDMSDTDSYGSSTPMQFSIPSLHLPPNKSETINSSLVINGISLDERILRGIKMDQCFEAVDILQSNCVVNLMFRCTDDHDEMKFNGTLREFNQALKRGGRSPENHFRLLDKYDEMAEAMEQLNFGSVIYMILTRLHDVVSIINDPKQKSIIEWGKWHVDEHIDREFKSWLSWEDDYGRTELMENGDIYPLTEAIMNSMKWIVDHSDTQKLKLFKIGEDDDQLDALRNHDRNSFKMNPVASQLLLVIKILEFNLENKSKLYADEALQCIFLMNNILYMKQKVEDSDLGGLLGHNWVCTRCAEITQYAKSYLRASWTKVLDCLNDRGTPWSSSSKASTVALQERLKNFNACFEEICRVQTVWIVPDAQLREELRISILDKVIPAYHSFMGRFGNQVESGGYAEQYIKYTADDLENYLSDLFKGIPRVLRTLVCIKPPVRGRVKRPPVRGRVKRPPVSV